ncbi:MAG TPA: 30S ribosome-binding factor RbfA [Terriglobales bacterium]|jgi:ribosome-binding factor A
MMDQNRAAQYHRERLADTMREEISEIVEGELTDPRIGLATVTQVQIVPDGRQAFVLVNVAGDAEEEKNTLAGLEAAKGYIKHELADRLRLRHSPELHFRLDRSQQYETRIDNLIERVKKRKK